MLTAAELGVVGIAAGAGAGLFRRLGRPPVPALPGDLGRAADPLPADHLSAFIAGFWDPARHHAACSAGPGWSGWSAPSSCAPATSTMSAARALGVGPPHHVPHILPNAMVAALTFLPFILAGSIGDHPDLARLPRLRPAARLAVAGRAAEPGQEQPQGAVARHHRLRSSPWHHARCWCSSARRCATPSTRARSSGRRGGHDRSRRGIGRGPSFGRGPRPGRCASRILRSTGGETMALVGESGSGKSVTALSIMQLLPYPPALPSDRQHPLRRPGAGGAARELRDVRAIGR